MPAGEKCVACGTRSAGKRPTDRHLTVAAENVEVVRICLAGALSEGADACEIITVGTRVCKGCWPAEELNAVGDLLGAGVMFQEGVKLRRGRCTGIRVPGSWQRQRNHGEPTRAREALRAPGELRLMEVLLDGSRAPATLSVDECRRAVQLCRAVSEAVDTAVQTERRRVHHLHETKQRQREDDDDVREMMLMMKVRAHYQRECDAAVAQVRKDASAITTASTFSMATMNEEFFSIKKNSGLFRSLTGFDDWKMGWVFFSTWFAPFVDEVRDGVTAFQWFIITSWIMRHNVTNAFLESFVGVTSTHLSRHTWAWACRMEKRAKHSFIGVPDLRYLLDTVPQCHVDNGMERCVAFGDGVDVQTDRVRVHSRIGQMQQSSKLDTSAARAVALGTGGGLVLGATPMVLARATEGALLQSPEMQAVLNKIPRPGEFAFDKGEPAMQSMCPHLNHCYVPTVVDGKSKGGQLTAQTGAASRGVAETRYAIEVIYRGAKTFRLLQTKVSRTRMRWIEPTWQWSLGFHNVVHAMLRVPKKESTYWKRYHPVYGHATSTWGQVKQKRDAKIDAFKAARAPADEIARDALLSLRDDRRMPGQKSSDAPDLGPISPTQSATHTRTRARRSSASIGA